MKRIHIFKAGRRTAMSGATIDFSEADIAAAAKAYDPQLHEAPIVVGHPKTDSPAHGWVAALAATGADLHATPRQVAAEFSEGVRTGAYKKVSAAFYPPDHPSNPVPGVYYLRHVGFLGAQPPAVKGLQAVEFADDGQNLVEIEFGDWTDGAVGRTLRQLREWLIGKFGLEEADKALPSWTADALIEASVTPEPAAATPNPAFVESTAQSTETQMPTKDELDAAQRELDAKTAKFAEREKELQAREAKTQRAEAAEFAEALVKEGRIPAAQRARVVELLFAAGGGELEFAEGETTVKASQADALRGFLKALPVQIEFSELTRADQDRAAGVDFKVPQGYSVDPRRAAKHREALAYAEKNAVDYVTAAQAVGA